MKTVIKLIIIVVILIILVFNLAADPLDCHSRLASGNAAVLLAETLSRQAKTRDEIYPPASMDEDEVVNPGMSRRAGLHDDA